MVIDSDNLNAGDQVWAQLCQAAPLLAQYARVETSSSSSNLFSGKKQLSHEKGLHTALHVADAADIPRALRALHCRLVMVGLSRYRLSRPGAILERSIVDQALAVPSQPVYLRPYLCGDTLSQKKRIEFFSGIEVVDTRVTIPDLTAEEEQAYRNAHDAACRALQADAAAAAAAYDAERGAKLPGGAAEAAAARTSHRLPDDWEIMLGDRERTVVTVGQILAAPAKYHGMTCRDPMEPEYNGFHVVGKIYTDQTPMINSMAHGRAAYHLGVPDIKALPWSQGNEAEPAEAADGSRQDSDPDEIATQYQRAAFPLSCLPASMAAACVEVQYDTQAPMAMVAGSALAAISIATMRLVDVVRTATLRGPTCLIVTEIAESGERKTTVDRRFSKAFRDYEEKAARSYAHDLAVWESCMAMLMKEERALDEAMRGALKAEAADVEPLPNEVRIKASDAIKKKLETFYAAHPEVLNSSRSKPKLRRILYEEASGEKIPQALSNYPIMAFMSDEGGVFAGSRAMGAESLMGTASKLNKGWDGSEIRKDLKGDGKSSSAAEICKTPRIGAHLMMQPGVFEKMTSVNDGQIRDIGLAARFLLSQPESTKGTRFLGGREQGSTLWIDAFNQRIEFILSIPAVVMDGSLVMHELPLSVAARAEWVAYHDKVEAMLGEAGIYGKISDIASKSAENAARIAACFTFYEHHYGASEIPAEVMRAACVVAEWYLNECLILFGLKTESQAVQDAIAVEACLIKQCVKTGKDYVTRNDLGKYISVRALRKKEGAERRNAAIILLIEKKRLRSENVGASTHLMPRPDLIVRAKVEL